MNLDLPKMGKLYILPHVNPSSSS